MNQSSASCVFTRDRLPEFLSLRGAARPTAELRPKSRETPPPWARTVRHFVELEGTVQSRIRRLQGEQQTFLQPNFLNDAEEETRRQRIEENTQGVQKLLRELERMIVSGMRPQDPANEDEVRAAENAKKHLSSRLSVMIQFFREGQELYAEQRRRREEKSRRYKRIGLPEAHERVEQEERIARYLEDGYAPVEIQALLEDDKRQQAINREVQEIVKSVTELHAMFKDVGAMVVEQGSVLDRIDFNVQQTYMQTKKGAAELREAREKQSYCCVM